MGKNTNFCKFCGKEYELCKTCESMRGRVFAYKQFFCSIECFKKNERGAGIMTIQYKGLTYNIKNYDLDKGEYTTSNDILVKEEDVEAFILSLEDFKKIKDYKKPILKQAKEV